MSAASGTSELPGQDAALLRRRIAEASEAVAALERERCALDEVELTLKGEERRCLQRIARADEECDELETRLEASESRAEQVHAELDEASRELGAIEQVVATLERGVERQESELHRLEEEGAALRRHVESAQQRVHSGVASVLRMDHRLRERERALDEEA